MGLKLTFENGQTPLDVEQINGLKIKSISTQEQLNEFEQANINEALIWLGKKKNINNLLSEQFVKELHKRMFGHVWRWAGEYRKVETNIGVKYFTIPLELRKLLDDVRFWMENKTYSDDEIAIRFKHKLVSIRCFPNGNGRHSRLMADLILIVHFFGLSNFSWGSADLVKAGDLRSRYLESLRLADKGDFSLLIEFARS